MPQECQNANCHLTICTGKEDRDKCTSEENCRHCGEQLCIVDEDNWDNNSVNQYI